MIYQVSPVKDKTLPLPRFNKALLQARHIQARLKKSVETLPSHVHLWSPMTAGPYLVPVTRWIE